MKNKQREENKVNEQFKVHTSIENRKKFKAKMLLRFLFLIIILICCAIMVMFGGWKWNPNEGFSPTTDPKQPYQYALIWIGSTLALLALLGYVIWTINTFKKFYRTQEEYFKTQDFKDKKAEAEKADPTKLTKSTIKWYKKMCYINSATKTDWLSKLASSKKK